MTEYWRERQEEMYQSGEMRVNQYFTRLEKAFNQTKQELRKTIEAFYFRYAEENGLSYSDARKRLDQTELGELREFIQLSMENIGKYNQEVNNMSIKARITRYQALEAQVDAILRQLYAVDYEAAAGQVMKEVYEEAYYRTWYAADQYRGYHASFAAIEPRIVETLLEYPFNGAAFSSRLWKQKDHLQTQLMEAVTTMLIQGKHPKTLAEDLAKKMRSKKFDAYRLLHTEGSFLMGQAAHAAYREDGVEKYQILATLDSKTCGLCGDLDGKVYEVEKAVTGVNIPPFHPLCRCTDMPYYDDMDLPGVLRVARDPDTGKTYEVSGNLTYKEWKKKYIENPLDSGTMEPESTKEAADVHIVGKIDRNIYKCITGDIVTDEVIITDNQIRHIKDRHPEALEKAMRDVKKAIESPDYIIEDSKHKNTGLVIKSIEIEGGYLQLVVRICTPYDEPGYKNSIISSWKISERRLQNYLRNKRILYKRE